MHHHLPTPLGKVAAIATFFLFGLSAPLFAISPAAAKHGNQGNQLAQAGKYDEAIAEFTAAIETDVKDPRFYLDRGRVYRLANKLPEAVADFNKAIELAPESDVAYFEKGKTELAQNQYEPALADLNKSIELNPNNPDAYYRRGLTLYQLKKYPEAIQDYTTAIEKNPNDLNAYNRRADVYVATRELEKALPDLEAALRLKPDDPATIQRLDFVKNSIAQRLPSTASQPVATPAPTPVPVNAFALTPLNILYGILILGVILMAILFWARSRRQRSSIDEV